MSPEQFIEKYGTLATQATEGTGLFPRIMLAQAALESAWGKSSLASQYNNFFGIKADSSWKGKKVNLKTKEVYGGNTVTVTDAFRVYDSPLEGFQDRISFLQDNPRYEKNGVFTAATPEAQAAALKAAGYATDPKYVSKLMSIVNARTLASYDKKKL